MKNKKGIEMSLNTVVIAAIALIVLIVLVFILTGRINVFGKGLEDCYSKGGSCETDCKTLTGGGYVGIPGTECDKNSQKCCIKVTAQ